MNILKSSIKISVLVIASCMYSSCDSLDLKPLDNYGSTNYWTKPEHIVGYMDGLHKNLRDKSFQHTMTFGEVRGGTSLVGNAVDGTSIDSEALKTQALSQVSTGVNKFGELYGLLANINIFLQKTKEATYMTDTEKAFYLGQAYGLRAFHYFDLYRLYGTVPLRLDPNFVVNGNFNPEELYLGRASGTAVMTQIKSDLEESLKYFGDNNSFDPNNRGNKKSYWSKAATEMLLGEVYLWNAKVSVDDNTANVADLAIAKKHLLNVVNNYGLGLQKKFSDVFSPSNKGNNEVIMVIRYLQGEETNSYNSFCYNYQTGQFKTIGFYDADGNALGDALNTGTTGMQRHEYKPELYLSYNSADTRRDQTFLAAYNKTGKLMGTVMRKIMGHFDTAKNSYVWDADAIIYRLPLAYLMLAEIANMEGDNMNVEYYINLVRERAYGEEWNKDKYGFKASDFTTNELAILHEKDKEFVGEGQRWWDVCRMTLSKGGKHLVFCPEASYATTEPILAEKDAYKVYWPIEVEMINKDPKLEQTPGYIKAEEEK